MFDDLKKLAEALPELLHLFERAVVALEAIAAKTPPDTEERRDA